MEPVEEPASPPTIWYRIARLLPAAVAGLSLLALPGALGTPNYVELAIVVLGLLGTGLYYYRKRQQASVEPAFTLFWVWALLQLPNLFLDTPAGHQPLWDTSNFLNLSFSMGFHTDAGNLLRVGLNLLPVLYFAWIRRLRIAENFGE